MLAPFRRPSAALLAVVLLAGLVPSRVDAQRADGAELPERLTLADAIAYAERWHPQFRSALNDEDVANAQLRSRQARYLPQINASVTTNSGGSRRFTGTDFYGNPVRLEDPATYSSSSSNQSVTASLELFDFGRREAEVRAARANRSAVRAGIQRQRLELRRQVTQRYYAALVAEANVTIAERQLEFAREQLELTERKFAIAAADREAVLGARANVAASEGSVDEARANAAKARLELAEAIGAPLDEAFALADVIPDYSNVQLDVEALVERALRSNPQILAAEAQAFAAERQVTAARAGYLPVLSAGGSFGRSMSSRGGSAFGELNPLDQSWGMSLTLSMPIFDRFQTSQAVTQARATREDNRETVRQQRLATERQVRAYVLDVESARRRLALAREAVELGRERLQLAQEGFQVGTISFDAYLQVLERLAGYERDELNARQTLATAVADLEQVVGEPIVERVP